MNWKTWSVLLGPDIIFEEISMRIRDGDLENMIGIGECICFRGRREKVW